MVTQANSAVDSPVASARLLAVSKQPSDLRPLWELADTNGWTCETVTNAWEALDRIQVRDATARDAEIDLVILDLGDDADALHAVRCLGYVRPHLPILLITRSGGHWLEAEALRLGARGFLAQPLQATRLQQVIVSSLGTAFRPRQAELAEEPICEAIERFGDDLVFVCATPAMQKLRVHAESLAQVDAPVLIIGEHGSGKECAARLIHQFSMRSGFPFVKIDCAAFPGDLLETELFGSKQGHPGKLELGQKGVVYLEDVAAMPLPLQARLLHVMQERSSVTSPLSPEGPAPPRMDARIIAATGPDAETAVAEGRLRRDLYYRLSAFSLQVPPLRLCRDAIPLLFGYFMSRLAKQYGLPSRNLSPALLKACQAHAWRGNMSELRDFAKRYLVVGDEELALWELKKHAAAHPQDSHVDLHWHGSEAPSHGAQNDGLKSLVRDIKSETERSAIANALEETHWNRKAAARLLRISYRTLLYKIQSYGMTPPTLPMLLRLGAKPEGRVE